MRAIRVKFSNGDTVTTDINGTDEEIRAYYVGKWFNFGDVVGPDIMVQGLSVEFLDSEVKSAGQAS